ncbi:MFS nicotinic acid transporter Tna1 [Sistotremastrum suecicum HHB10207 ss-3]|uniref:MFS nicotinic acid transporter Tna1 n=1 Tax=Sistotremastrum suecicum HHB10207 ss-3 TaxID=1314776 RepID=A0A166B884_9AGAM|nr:MFS nicotinic acid transporter Tna1 [Sistotremastrum suecicum HHB10207 ss-3]
MTTPTSKPMSHSPSSIPSLAQTEKEKEYEGEGEGINSPPEFSKKEIKALYRKTDFRIMPILALLYLCCQIDRGNIANAAIEGLTTSLHLGGNRFNIALTLFFIPYCLLEVPSNLVVKYFRPSRWIPFLAVLWGIVMTLMGLVKTYHQLVAVRACLGIAEAGLFPGVIYYLTFWYPRHELSFRIGLFFAAASMSGAFSGLLAYGISFMDGIQGLRAWQWIFILEGIATIAAGLLASLVLYDFPSTATYLTDSERAYIVWRQKYAYSEQGEDEQFSWIYVRDAVCDWQVWTHVLLYMSIVGPLYGIVFFTPTVVKTFGFNTPDTQLMTVPLYVCATLVLLTNSYFSDLTKLRSPFILFSFTLNVIGFSILLSAVSWGVKYFALFLVLSGVYSGFPVMLSWASNNFAGHYKRCVAMAIHIGIGNFSGAIFSNVYRSKDAPRYIFGHAMGMGFTWLGIFIVLFNVFLYRRINAKRDKILAEHNGGEDGKIEVKAEEVRRMGDKAVTFRYNL